MRKVLAEIRNLVICEDSVAAPAWLDGHTPDDSPLPFTVWTSAGYFVRAFLAENEATTFALDEQTQASERTFVLDGGDELYLSGFADDLGKATSPAQRVEGSSCWIKTSKGELIDKVQDLALAAQALLAQKARSAASITGPHPVLTPRKP